MNKPNPYGICRCKQCKSLRGAKKPNKKWWRAKIKRLKKQIRKGKEVKKGIYIA